MRIGSSFFDGIGQDLRYGVRRLSAAPVVTAAVIVTFALGIGANAAMFSFVNAVVLRPLPFPDADRLVRVFQAAVRSPEDESGLPPATFEALERDNQSFASIAGYQTMADGFSLVVGDHAIQAYGARVTAGFFDVLGVRPLRGGTCAAGDDRAGAAAKAVIGAAFWRSQFHSDPQIVGQAVRLNGQSVSIAGVMPDDFWFPRGDFASVWLCSPGGWPYQVVARLQPGATAGQVQSDLRRFVTANPAAAEPWLLTTRPLQSVFIGDLRPVLWLLVAAVVIVLGIACVNVTNLLLARAVGRRQEMSVRAALGARSSRLVRQMFTESLVLAGAGTAAGVLVARWMIPAFVALMPRDLQAVRDAHVAIDFRVLAWVATAGLAAAIVWGTWPGLAAVNRRLNGVTGAGRGPLEGPGRSRLRQAFIAAEFAMAVLLAVASGLVTRSLLRLEHVDSGVQPDHVVTATIALSSPAYASPDTVTAFYDRLLGGVRALPGVSSAAISFGLPPDRVLDGAAIAAPGRAGSLIQAEMVTVSNDYFRTLRIPVVAGRSFDSRDTATSAPAVIISQTLARRAFGAADPIGHPLRVSGDPAIVVGVALDVKYAGLDGPGEPVVYIPFARNPFTYMALIVRTNGESPSLMTEVRARLAALDADAALGRVRTMNELLADSVGRPRFTTMLFMAFAVVALALSAVGAFGVMLYSVSQKTREIGVRIALGARRGDIAALVAGEGLSAALVGIAIGVIAAAGATRVMRALLFGVAPTDPVSFGAAVSVLVAIAALACWVPARRAARIDPVIALRDR
jgi:putative ABC transport system permease protein